jgi:hypothetical protein
MALPGESLDVILEGFDGLLSATYEVLGVVGLHIRALEVVGEDVSEVIPTINDVFMADDPARPWRKQVNRCHTPVLKR